MLVGNPPVIPAIHLLWSLQDAGFQASKTGVNQRPRQAAVTINQGEETEDKESVKRLLRLRKPCDQKWSVHC